MKKFLKYITSGAPSLNIFVAVAAAMAIAVVANMSPAEASPGSTPMSQQPRIAFYAEPGLNTSSTITSPIYNLANVSECTVMADNSANVTAARTLNVKWISATTSTPLFQYDQTVASSTRAMVVISTQAVANATSTAANLAVLPAHTGKRMQFVFSSSPTFLGSLAIACQ